MSLILPDPTVPRTLSKADSAEIRAVFAALVAKFTKGIDATDITDEAMLDRLMDPSNSIQNYLASFAVSFPYGFTESGGLGIDAASLVHTVPACIAYPRKTSATPQKLIRVDIPSESHTYTANRDTYVSAKADGSFDYNEQANGSSTPPVPTDCTPLMKVVSGAASLTVTDMRILISASSQVSPKNFRTGCEPVWKTATTVALASGAIDYGGVFLLQTGESTALSITNSGNFISGSPGNNQWQYLYGASNGAGGISLKWSTGAPNASDYAGTAAVAGYDALWRLFSGVPYRCFGACLTDSSGNVLKFYRKGTVVYWDERPQILSSGTAASFTAVSAAAAMPPTSRSVYLSAVITNSTDVYLRATGSTATNGTVYLQENSHNFACTIWMPTNSAQSFDYKNGTGDLDLFVSGYEEVL